MASPWGDFVHFGAAIALLAGMAALGTLNLAAPLLTLVGLGACFLALETKERRFVLRCAAISAAAGWLMIAAIHAGLAAWAEEWPYFPDEAQYLSEFRLVAEHWSEGRFPDLRHKDLLGSLHTGYQRIGALLAVVWNDVRLPALLLSAFLIPMVGVGIALLTIVLRRGDAPALTALLPVLLHPAHAFWGAFVLRETLHLAVLLALLSLTAWQLLLPGRRPWWGWLAVFGAAWWSFTIRSYSCAIAMLILLIWFRVCVQRRSLAPWVGAGLFGLLVAAFYPPIGRILDQMADTLATVAFDYSATAAGAVRDALLAVPRLLWAPYPWVREEGFQLYYLLYPALWLQALVVWPCVVQRLPSGDFWREPRGLFFLFGAAYAVSLLIAFGGDAPRHVYPIMILSGCTLGWPAPKVRRSTVLFWSYWVALAGFIAMQQINQYLL